MKEKILDIKTIVATAIGGVMLLLATVFLASFVSSPPTRAEFDTLKGEFLSTQRSIDNRLETIEDGQKVIIEHLLQKKD